MSMRSVVKSWQGDKGDQGIVLGKHHVEEFVKIRVAAEGKTSEGVDEGQRCNSQVCPKNRELRSHGKDFGRKGT